MGLFQPNLEKMKMQKNVAGLVQATAHKDFHTRVLAVQALGQVGGQQAVEALLALLQDPTSRLEEAAARALGAIGDPAAVAPLVAALREYSTLGPVAAEALIEIGLPAIEPVAAALRDRATRRLAAQVLDSIGRPADPETQVWYAIAKERWSHAGEVGPVALEPLLASLREEEDELERAGLAYTLGEMGDPRAVEPLIAILQDRAEDQKARHSAAEALRKIGDPRALAPLNAVLQDRAGEPELRQCAAKALGRFGPPAVDALVPVLQDQAESPEVRQEAARALGNLGAPAVDGLIAVLPDAALGREAVYALVRIGDTRAVEPLLALHLGTRDAGVLALGRFRDPRARGPLIAALADEDADYAKDAALALGAMSDPRAVEPLVAALELRQPSYFFTEAVARALGQIGGQRALEALLALFQNEDHRAHAVEALAQFDDPRAIRTLVAALCETWPPTREAAKEGLVAHGAAALGPLRAALHSKNDTLATAAAGVLGQLGPPAVEALIGALVPGSDSLRWAIAAALGEIRDPRATNPLLACYGDKNVRQPVTKALAKIADPRTVEPLIAALKDENVHVRYAAAEGLGAIGDATALVPLLTALVVEKDIRYGVKEALARLGGLAVEPLVRVLQDRRWEERHVAAQILGQIADPRAAPALLAALQEEDMYVREAAAEALGQIDTPQAVEPLCALLRDDVWFVRKAAAEALGRIADPRAGRALRGALKDEMDNVGKAAREALGQLRLPAKWAGSSKAGG